MNLKIEYLNKEELKPYAKNAKRHTPRQVEQIKASIREFGFNDPIAVWKGNEIIEGHGRLLAAMEMEEIKAVPVIRLDGLSDAQRKAYGIAHNKLTMNTDFDLNVLALEIKQLTDEFEIDMTDFGFNEAEILDLVAIENPLDDEPTSTSESASGGYDTGGYSGGGADYSGGGGISKEELDYYSQRADQSVTKRVIIVYSTDEEEAFLKQILRQEADKPLGVVLDTKAIMKVAQGNEQE